MSSKLTKGLEKRGALNQMLTVMTVRRGRRGRNIGSTNTVAASIPRSTTTMKLTLQVKIVMKVALVRTKEDNYIKKEAASIIEIIQVCFSSHYIPLYSAVGNKLGLGFNAVSH